jgi:uncharacterized protein YqeY
MPLAEKIQEDLKRALKAREESRVSCLRLLKSSLKNRQVEKGGELTDEEIQAVISSLIKKGREASREFLEADRKDLASKEEEEINILYEYLPDQLTEAEIEGILKEIIAELSANTLKDLGRVMKIAMSRMAGKAQGKEVNEIARRLLG